MIPVLCFEETLEDSTKDWTIYIRYEGDDVYVLYGRRNCCKKHKAVKMQFTSPLSLTKFLMKAMDIDNSSISITLYGENDKVLNDNTYNNYNQRRNNKQQNHNNELFGYDNVILKENEIMDLLLILQDSYT